MNTRAIAVKSITDVLANKYSLLTIDYRLSQLQITDQDKSFIKLLCYEFFRNYYSIEKITQIVINKNTKSNIKTLIMLGILQLLEINQPHYATINETVNACKDLKVIWAKKLVNGVLRNILRNIEQIKIEYLEYKLTDIPNWITNVFKEQYPKLHLKIAKGINSKANMFIRLNSSKDPRIVTNHLKENDIIFSTTKVENCIKLETAIDIQKNQLFHNGYFTVQDISAQYAGWIIDPKGTDNILDACAAPGGKTTHLIELNPETKITAVDILDKRLELLKSNITRINPSNNISIVKHDLSKPFNGKFNKIVFDAPCSALGTIKRNPDIKLLRKPKDIENIQQLQQQILQNLWDNNLEENGYLLYITCSILKQENQDQIKRFLKNNHDAKIEKILLLEEYKTDFGYQILPFEENGDGFYYCLIRKLGSTNKNRA
ncbi:16S rRNA (cytosine(967)-C(5))-methyltransferase RsmB [Allofrancisella guangzhouensis]|uniref:16S rRNA (cytosine(967)-C(5))-methyltransferase n=1 Tax=Allofrancisella guangzhouensis TaxID=594679 RepID=A0A0A8E450_9GAMM|nr:16S rRNA (cytosine(967)-C(5))-methyltransferase RsmB [Allofrancisella guangzhouensis]AJC48778.1 16S rRNA methyltransferase [Allofrancisella guangzhouensis]MBK2027998.1 16S rRNA (cytosine(967)-C(5))-methyltransferase RsmB [Allofrancisella guangzhouensis]MBK2044420.1 16S rRNA (cytosine(967)-C(5))-methyltransferase RsmB [Allofrancisella guangzhouensis]MBK2045274.1 16S rRNA (cytosine(967)-C(5))-methyltransferase RsmB [Allofrancisella guangzhouensis]